MAIIKGNIGSEIKRINGRERDFFSFTLAENNGENRAATWYEVTAFIDEGDADLLSKGEWVEITGRLEAHAYAKKDGTPAASLRLVTGKVKVLERNRA